MWPFAVLCCSVVATERPAEGRRKRPGPDEAVARVDGFTLTREEIQTRINGQVPEVRRKYRSLEARREFVDRQIDLELLAAEARRRGLEADAEVRRVISQALAHRLLELEANSVPAPGEDRIQAFWEEHAADYAKPATRRVAHLLVQPRKRGGRRRAREKAKALYEEAAASQDDHEHFRRLVEAHTDDSDTRLRAGDLRYFTRDDESIPDAVRETAFAMELGEVATCESPLGFHVLKLIGRRGARNPGLENVREKVVRRLQREQRKRAGDRLLESLRQDASIEVDEKALRRVRLERP